MVGLDDVSEVNNVSLSESSDGLLWHFNCVVEFILSQLDLQLFVILHWLSCKLWLVTASLEILLDKSRVRASQIVAHELATMLAELWHFSTQEVVGSVVSFSFDILVRNNIWRVHLGDQVSARLTSHLMLDVLSVSQIVHAVKGARLHFCAPEWALRTFSLASVIDCEHLLSVFVSLDLHSFVKQLFSLYNPSMQGRQQVFCSFKHVFVELGWVVTRHALVPNINNDQDVFDPHSLQKRQKLLATAFLIAVIVTFSHICWFFSISKWLLIGTIRAWSDSVGHNAAFSLGNASLASNVIEHKVDMGLVADGSWKWLELCAASRFLLSKADRVQHRFHFFHHRSHVSWKVLSIFLHLNELLVIVILSLLHAVRDELTLTGSDIATSSFFLLLLTKVDGDLFVFVFIIACRIVLVLGRALSCWPLRW